MSDILSVRGYLPEYELLKNKHQPPARVCREHLAVVEPAASYRILASRGIGLPTGKDFCVAAMLSEPERSALAEAASRPTPSLITANGRPLLVLTDWMADLGLLLLLILECRHEAAYAAASVLCPNASLPEIPIKKCKPAEGREAREILSDILSYTNVMCRKRFDGIELTDPIRRLAAFAGYRLDAQTVQAISRQSTPAIRSQKALAFLFCAFLALRDRMGALSTGDEAPLCRISFSETAYPPRVADDIPTFVHAACFSDCIVCRGTGNTLELCFAPAAIATLSSHPASPLTYLLIQIEPK